MSISSRTEELFSNKLLFEQEVLNVRSDEDKEEIHNLLVTSLVEDILKEHINFLYIENFSDFTLKQIVNIVFKEVANEWVDYAMHELNYSKENALGELRIQNRVKFLKSLSHDYYQDFKEIIFEKIADSFMELLVQDLREGQKSILINAVINSDLISERSILNINSADQLRESVKIAMNSRSDDTLKIESFNTTLQKVKKSILYSLYRVEY